MPNIRNQNNPTQSRTEVVEMPVQIAAAHNTCIPIYIKTNSRVFQVNPLFCSERLTLSPSVSKVCSQTVVCLEGILCVNAFEHCHSFVIKGPRSEERSAPRVRGPRSKPFRLVWPRSTKRLLGPRWRKAKRDREGCPEGVRPLGRINAIRTSDLGPS